MKKLLLIIVATMFAVSGYSELPNTLSWSSEVQAHATDVKYGAWAQTSPIAAVSDGTVYVTGTFDQEITLNPLNTALVPVAKSAFLAKYGKDGNALWAVALQGAATITAVSADENGVVVAGVFADEVKVGSEGSEGTTITGMADNANEVSAFILRYDASGKLLASKVIVPELDEELVNSFMYFPEGGDTYFKPSQVQLDGEKVYLSAKYSAVNKLSDALTLKGSAVNVWDFMYMDIAAMAIVSFDANLENPELVYDVKTSEALSYNQMEPTSLTFTVADGKVWAAGSGYGTLAVSGQQTGTLEYAMDGEGNNEYGMFIIDPTKGVEVFHAQATDRSNIDNAVKYLLFNDGCLELVGTFSDNLPFDNTKKEEGANAMFSAIYDVENSTFTNIAVSGLNKEKNQIEVLTGVVKSEGETFLTGYLFDETYGEEKVVSNINYAAEGQFLVMLNTDRFVTAFDSKEEGTCYTMSGADGKYTLSYYACEDTLSVDEPLWKHGIQAHATDVKYGEWAQTSPIAAVSDGTVYVTGTFDQNITLNPLNSVLVPVAKSAFLAKYGEDGNALWAVALQGAATITAVSADENGVVVAGVFADEVKVGSEGSEGTTITGMADNANEVSAFILRYDANGKLLASKVIVPELDEELVNSFMYFPEGGDTYFKPSQVQLDGEKIYLSAKYSAVNKLSDALTLNGSAVNVFDFMYMDIASMAIVSFDTNLENAELVYDVKISEALSYNQMEPTSLTFTVADGKVWAAGSGYGTLVVCGQQTGTLEYTMDGEGNTEYGMFIIDPVKGVKVFHAEATDRSNVANEISYVSYEDGGLGIVGTFSHCLPFDNTKKENGGNAIFVASYDTEKEAVAGAFASEETLEKNEEEVITGVVPTQEGLIISGYKLDRTYGNVHIVAPLNYMLDEEGLTTTGEEGILVTAIDMKAPGKMYVMSATEGAYNLSLYADENSEEAFEELQQTIEKYGQLEVIGGDAPGYYPKTLADNYNLALETAKSATLEDDSEFLKSVSKELQDEYDRLTATGVNPIETGYYYIVSAGNGPGYSGGSFNYENKFALYNAAGRVQWSAFDEENLAQVYYFEPSTDENTWMAKNIADDSYIEKGTGLYGCEVSTSAEAVEGQLFTWLKEGKFAVRSESGTYMYSLKANHDGPGAETTGKLSIWGTANEALQFGVNQWYLVPCSAEVIEKITAAKAVVAKDGNYGKVFNLQGIEVGKNYNGFKVYNGKVIK